MVDSCCEQCGLDLSIYDNIDILEAELTGDWVQIILQCVCGAAYSHDAQLRHFDYVPGGGHAVIRFAKEDTGAE